MNKKRLLWRLSSGAKNNVRFRDFVALIEAFGFIKLRQRGSHQSFAHPDVPDLLVVQDRDGQAVPYQIGDLLSLVEEYGLKLENEDGD